MPRSKITSLTALTVANSVLLRLIFPECGAPVSGFAATVRQKLKLFQTNEIKRKVKQKESILEQLVVRQFVGSEGAARDINIGDFDSLMSLIEDEKKYLPKIIYGPGVIEELRNLKHGLVGGAMNFGASLANLSFFPQGLSAKDFGTVKEEVIALQCAVAILGMDRLPSLDTFTYILNAKSKKIKPRVLEVLLAYWEYKDPTIKIISDIDFSKYRSDIEERVEEHLPKLNEYYGKDKMNIQFHELLDQISESLPLATLPPRKLRFDESVKSIRGLVSSVNDLLPAGLEIANMAIDAKYTVEIICAMEEHLYKLEKTAFAMGRFRVNIAAIPNKLFSGLELVSVYIKWRESPAGIELVTLEAEVGKQAKIVKACREFPNELIIIPLNEYLLATPVITLEPGGITVLTAIEDADRGLRNSFDGDTVFIKYCGK